MPRSFLPSMSHRTSQEDSTFPVVWHGRGYRSFCARGVQISITRFNLPTLYNIVAMFVSKPNPESKKIDHLPALHYRTKRGDGNQTQARDLTSQDWSKTTLLSHFFYTQAGRHCLRMSITSSHLQRKAVRKVTDQDILSPVRKRWLGPI